MSDHQESFPFADGSVYGGDGVRPSSRKPSPSVARIKRDEGMERVIDHADRVETGWSEECLCLLRLFLMEHTEPFLTEDFRAWTAGKIALPPDGRAFGPIIMRAKRNGLIRTAGVARAATSNLSLKPLWEPVA